MSTTMTCQTETRAVITPREFTIHLDFVEGEIMKTVRIVHPDWTPEKLLAAIRNEDDSVHDSRDTGTGAAQQLLRNLKCAHSEGKIVTGAPGRRSKKVVIAEYWVSDGVVMARDFTAIEEGNEI